MDPESGAGTPNSRLKLSKAALCLAYQSLGVVYGDLSISPIYVFTSTFTGKMRLHLEEDEILGALSLVFWTLTLIPFCKYVLLVLGADDNGEGGTFALYSLLCRHAKVGLLSDSHVSQDIVYSHNTEPVLKETKAASLLKVFFQKHQGSRVILLLVVLLGTSMVIGDGVLTPSMSDYAVLIACVILVGLFFLQQYGTHRVGFLFAPVMITWLLCISGLGIYNIRHWNPCIFSALSPHYAFNYIKMAGKDGWSSLGGIVLCITGAEAMFADLGHFSQISIKIAFTLFVYPCLILAYMGEAAYLSKNKNNIEGSFYKAIPETIFWPVFIIATLATVVGSQAIISATFSIISQCRALSCFPRVKIIHTSKQIHGQIYIPEVNWTLLVLCLGIVIGFRDTAMIGNAYGLAVIIVMFVTTCLMFLVIITVWKRAVLLAVLFVICFGSVELFYLSSCLNKVHKGGWLPLLISLVVLSIMCIWHYGTIKKNSFEVENKVTLDTLLSLGPNLSTKRVPGIGLIYSSVTSGVPPMFAHFVANFPAFHNIVIFVTIQSLTVPTIPACERFVVSRMGPPASRLFRCVVRYGYKDTRKDVYTFENHLIETLGEFLQCKANGIEEGDNGVEMAVMRQPSSPRMDGVSVHPESGVGGGRRKVRFQCMDKTSKEMAELEEAREAGLAYVMGNTCVIASETSSWLKKFVINIVYGFLRRNCRRPATALGVPHRCLIEVGMVYVV
ncbi:Potassium transporter [Dillenia turbinata]|uniref:Potassium transporter n=1 Tax=Dillenia turbinata TaxID=194707 RepID=A0AAN8YVR6_9MAGN